jgi:hypothetical protein
MPNEGQLLLDRPLRQFHELFSDFRNLIYEAEEDPDDTPVAEVKASLKRAFQEAKTR